MDPLGDNGFPCSRCGALTPVNGIRATMERPALRCWRASASVLAGLYRDVGMDRRDARGRERLAKVDMGRTGGAV